MTIFILCFFTLAFPTLFFFTNFIVFVYFCNVGLDVLLLNIKTDL